MSNDKLAAAYHRGTHGELAAAHRRIAELQAVIDAAPHGSDCQTLQVYPTAAQILDNTWRDGDCTCWKVTAPRDALDARIRDGRVDERRQWADYFASWGSHVGTPPFTQGSVVTLLRAVHRPFGADSKQEGASDGN